MQFSSFLVDTIMGSTYQYHPDGRIKFVDAHKKYEFGCKISVVTTSKNNWVVGVDAVHGNPYAG